MKLNPIIREDFAFLRRRAWALAPLWLLAAAISWSLPVHQFRASLVWVNVGIVVALAVAPMASHIVRWEFFGW